MKNLSTLLILFLVLSLSSCEEVIDLDLEQSEPRLVIDASLLWYKNTTGNEQQIVLSKTTGFYEDEPQPVIEAEVIIEAANGEEFIFVHQSRNLY